MENVCEEFEFKLANFYAPDKRYRYLSCKDQPYHIWVDTSIDILNRKEDKQLKAFQLKSQEIVIKKGDDNLLGRVWSEYNHEWIKNV